MLTFFQPSEQTIKDGIIISIRNESYNMKALETSNFLKLLCILLYISTHAAFSKMD